MLLIDHQDHHEPRRHCPAGCNKARTRKEIWTILTRFCSESVQLCRSRLVFIVQKRTESFKTSQRADQQRVK
jgi:hypothetical protein